MIFLSGFLRSARTLTQALGSACLWSCCWRSSSAVLFRSLSAETRSLGAAALILPLTGLLPLPPLAPRSTPRMPDAQEIFRRAERIRNPDSEFAVNITIESFFPGVPGQPHVALYAMVTRGSGRSMILMLAPDDMFGTTLLVSEGRYWLLLPRTTRPFELSETSILRGDIGMSDVARADLRAEFKPRLDGDEIVEGTRCWRLELSRIGGRRSYTRIRYWVDQTTSRPRKLEYFGYTGQRLKVAVYDEYRAGPLGEQPARVTVQSVLQEGQKTLLRFAPLRRVDASHIVFSPDGMIAFRDVALRLRRTLGKPPELDRLLSQLGPAKP